MDNWLQTFSNLNWALLEELQEKMKEINPYAQEYCHVGDVIKQSPTADVKLVLKE